MEIFGHENAPLFFAFVYFQITGNLVREDESAKEKQDRKHRHNRTFPSDDGIVPFGLSVLSNFLASKLDSEPVQKSSRYLSRVMRKHDFVYIYIWENKGTDQRHNNLTADQHLYFHHLSQ